MYCILTFSPSFKTMEGAGGGERERKKGGEKRGGGACALHCVKNDL